MKRLLCLIGFNTNVVGVCGLDFTVVSVNVIASDDTTTRLKLIQHSLWTTRVWAREFPSYCRQFPTERDSSSESKPKANFGSSGDGVYLYD